jgi:hypothetical protein
MARTDSPTLEDCLAIQNTMDGNVLRRFMTIGTCGPCVQLGDYIDKCMEFNPTGTIEETELCNMSLVTWVPQCRVPILLISLGDACTAVCIQETGNVYYATETISLPAKTPAGCILLAHYTEDVIDSHRRPRVLVYDVATWGTSMSSSAYAQRIQYEDLSTVAPKERYRILREELGPLLHSCTATSNTIVLQWVGYIDGARKFLDGTIHVGHEVETLLELSRENALRPKLLRDPDVKL